MKKVKKLICATLLLLLVAVLFSLSACRDDSTCVLTLDPAGGTLLDASSLKVEKGESVTLPVPVRDGYTFVGWYTGTSIFAEQVTDASSITEDKQLIAHWRQNAPMELKYMLNPDGRSYTCIGIGTYDGKNIVIPEQYNGLPVTAVGEKAFMEIGRSTVFPSRHRSQPLKRAHSQNATRCLRSPSRKTAYSQRSQGWSLTNSTGLFMAALC